MVATADGGRVEVRSGTLVGAVLEIPAGALVEETEITVRVVEGEPAPGAVIDLAADPAAIEDLARVLSEVVTNWEDLTQYGVLFLLEHLATGGATTTGPTLELTPDGLTFDVPVRLTIPYDASLLDDPSLVGALRVMHTGSDGHMRILTPTFDEAASTLTVELEHFSHVHLLDGFANTASGLGGTPDGSGGVTIPTEGTLLDNDTASSDCSVLSGISEGVDRFQDALTYTCTEYPADYSIPGHVNGAHMMAHLSIMRVIFSPWAEMDTVQSEYVTGHEQELMHFIRDAEGQTSYADAYAEAFKLNRGNVFQSLMTIHNMVRFREYTPCFVLDACEHIDDYVGSPDVVWSAEDREYLRGAFRSRLAPMTDIHPEISDTYGAWYHMSGLTALSLMNDSSLVSLLASAADEYIVSGLYNSDFDCGEQIANQIASLSGSGSSLATAAMGVPPAGRCYCGGASDACSGDGASECCDGLSCVIGACADCAGAPGLNEVCDPASSSACCGGLTCSPMTTGGTECCATQYEPCETSANCCGEMQCDGGQCACRAVGETCLSARECCGGSLCTGGTCT